MSHISANNYDKIINFFLNCLIFLKDSICGIINDQSCIGKEIQNLCCSNLCKLDQKHSIWNKICIWQYLTFPHAKYGEYSLIIKYFMAETNFSVQYSHLGLRELIDFDFKFEMHKMFNFSWPFQIKVHKLIEIIY